MTQHPHNQAPASLTARYTSLIQPFRERAQRDPQQLALVLIHDDGAEERLSVGELHEEAVAYARALRALGIEPGDIVVLVMGHSRALISTLLGALCLRAVPTVFPYSTEKLDPTVYAERVRALMVGSGARAVVTGAAFHDRMATLLSGLSCRVIDAAELSRASHGESPINLDAASLDDVAFLQYTSGTTGLQKGVPNTHGAVLRYIEARLAIYTSTQDDVIVSWLPLYHDLGMVATLLIPIVLGVPTVLMSPFRWVRDPKVLFRALHEFRGTRTWLPNFALNHSVQGIRERDLEGLDLSHVRSVICGGEQVRLESRQKFLERFARCGLRETVLQTAYGMAENCCGATMAPPGRPLRVDWIRTADFERSREAVPAPADAPGSMALVSCGPPFPGVELRIEDGGRQLGDRHIGEIVLRGPFLFPGYYNRPDLTAKAIHDGWFHTGDLGYLADGELYICGRKSDLIIVGGRNLYPDDLEALAATVPGLVPGRAVAFGVPDERDGTERVVLVCEAKPDLESEQRDEMNRVLRRRAARELDITLGDVRFVGKGWVIKTSNGKIAHTANRDKYVREFCARA